MPKAGSLRDTRELSAQAEAVYNQLIEAGKFREAKKLAADSRRVFQNEVERWQIQADFWGNREHKAQLHLTLKGT